MIGVVLSCEHASWMLPPDVDLGVPLDVVQSQAGWDHGAFEIAARLSEAVGIPAHAGAFSRMFVDLNRAPDHPHVIPINSYGAAVPGNAGLTEDERASRLAAFHAPYWDAVRRDVAARLLDRGACVHLSSHSFDPALDPAARTYELGVLYDPEHDFEAQLAERLLFSLRSGGFDVRANQPYAGTGPSICTALRGALAGERYAGIQLETSHLVTRTPGGCARVAHALIQFMDAMGRR
ncbi:MAG: N-formylglutamate amidohydrolase [Kofleriaceae bacterium]